MKFFQLKPEQWLLFGVLVVFGVALLAKVFLLPEKSGPPSPGHGKNVSPLNVDRYAGMADEWAKAPELAVGEHKIFVSRLIVYHPTSGKIEWLNPQDPMEDGITAGWKIKYGFPIDDLKVADADPDNDGFTNKEEFLAKTNPLDPNSRPPIIVKLRIAHYTKVPFRMVFKAANKLSDGTIQFQINLMDVSRNRTRFVKKGDETEGYKVGDYREKIVEVFDEKTHSLTHPDRSELDMINTKLDEVTTLVLNTEKESDESRVAFSINVPGKKVEPSEVKRGDSFKLDDKSYQVLKASPQEATIKDLASGETIQISAATTMPAPAPPTQ
ncbi:MAG: thrombospondin type 3 repeat-containing protein [Methylacidiphilales bacterium]|nr:thrombospondin type 3 repeat-containing protein [Candidatus Methylacidiphilales bacterium]